MFKNWIKECEKHNVPKIGEIRDNYYIYKGFKVSYHEVMDVRTSDFYSEVKDKDMNTLKKYGFIRGSDIIMYQRDCSRVKRYTKKLEKFYKNKKELSKETPEKEYKRRLSSLNSLMRNTQDLLQFYKTRKTQYETKYNS